MRAQAERRVLVTLDKHFLQLVFAGGQAHCGLVRLPDVPATQRQLLLNRIITDFGPALEGGSVVTIRGDRLRLSQPPTSPR